jgi:hypothetical protein
MQARLILLLAEGPERAIAKRGASQAPAARAVVEVRNCRRVVVIGVMVVLSVDLMSLENSHHHIQI